MYTNRVVAAVAPICALAAGACATWIAEHFPGINVPASALNEIFLAGAVAVLAPALQWLYGWQQHEKREAEADLAVEKAQAGVSDVTVKVDTDETESDSLFDGEDTADLAEEDFDLESDELDFAAEEEEELDVAMVNGGGDLDTERSDG